MSKTPPIPFSDIVTRFFTPIADKVGLTLRELADDVYEIEAPTFTMRIRRGTGHRKDILVTLLPTAGRPTDAGNLDAEIGLGVIAEFNRERFLEPPVQSEQDYLQRAEYLARASEKLIIPYLLDGKNDYDQLKQFVERRAESASREVPDYRLPKNVRKEWL